MERPAPRHAAAVLALALAVLAGCANSTPAGPFPPRPADIDTNTVDLCTALTPEQQDELGVEPGMAKTAELSDGPTRICSWSNFDDGYNYSVQTTPVPAAVTVGSLDSALGVIGGYGAVRVTAYTTSVPLCTYYVDTSDLVGIRTSAQSTATATNLRPTPIEEVCRRAEAFTTHVVENLRPAV